MQLFIDGRSNSDDLYSLWSRTAAVRTSNKIVKAAKMQIFYGPRAYESGSLLVCFTMIAESHISLHLDRKTGLAFVDIFTCKPSSQEDVENFERIVREGLSIEFGKSYGLDRGNLN